LSFFFIASSKIIYKIKEGNTRDFGIEATPENYSEPMGKVGTLYWRENGITLE